MNRLLNQFRKANPPSFLGEHDLVKVERWVMQLEKIFGLLECTMDQRVSLATYMLEGGGRILVERCKEALRV